MSRIAVAAVAGLLLLAPAHAEEGDESERFRSIFEDQMEERLEELRSEGVNVRAVTGLWVDFLAPPPDGGAQAERTIPFSGGSEGQYLVMALCDGDCTDIDLQLYGADQDPEEDDPLESDSEDDAEPVLLPGLFGNGLEDGAYTVQLQMWECEAAYCWFAVGIYALVEEAE